MFLESQLKHSVYHSLSLVQPSFVGTLRFDVPLSLAWHHEAGWKFADQQVPVLISTPTWVCVQLLFFQNSFFSVSQICFLSGLLQKSLHENVPVLSAFCFYEDNQSWLEKHNLWLFKWSMMSLKCGLPIVTKWSYFCEEGRKIKWCYTSICIYVFLYRLGEYCQNIYDKLYHCLCLYFFNCDIPHRHINCCTFECPKFIF